MNKWVWVIWLGGVLALSPAAATQLGVLAPVMDGKAPLTRRAPDAPEQAPVLTRVQGGPLYEALQREAAEGFTARMLALDAQAQGLAGGSGISWLQLSAEEGGFARQGFWLREAQGERWVDEPYVDLVVTAASVEDGSFEEIFAHELGHVLLRRLLPALPAGYSRTPHHSFSVTDQQTAFDEGWAIHFQAMARRYTRNARLAAQDDGSEYKPFIPFWLHAADRSARIDGVRQNWFAHRQLPMPGAGDAVQRQDLSTLFDRARLKSGAQMLASEGMLATFFYRHLAPGEAATLAARYAPLFAALRRLNARAGGLDTDTPLLPELARALLAESPEQGARFLRMLLETSYGALSSRPLAALSEAAARQGRLGDAQAFVPALTAARQALEAEAAALLAAPARLGATVGPALWLRTPGAAMLDLNTAELAQLQQVPGVTAAAARRALASRARDGDFGSVAEFARRTGLAAAPLQAMARAAREAGPQPRR